MFLSKKIILTTLLLLISTLYSIDLNAACVARHKDSFKITEISPLPVDSAAALDAATKCVEKAIKRKLDPCKCWVACSPAIMPVSLAEAVATAIESYVVSNTLPDNVCNKGD